MKKQKRRHLWLAAGAMSLILAGCKPEVTEPPQGPVEHVVQAADGVPLHYDVTGSGELALVFVHCWTCDRGFWDAQLPHFAADYTVVRVELAGHGRSGQGRKRYDMASFGADVAAVVDDLGLTRVVLIGHSMGGPVSVEAARRLGDRVVGVVGVDTFYTGFEYPDDDQRIAAFVQPFEQNFAEATGNMVRVNFPAGADPRLVERVVAHMQGADQTMAISAMYEIFYWGRGNMPDSLDVLGKRLRNINGDPGRDNKPLHESVVLIPGTGHFPQMEQPEAFNAALETILAQF